ncbi:unnamed protein product [Euphydryas editha]|uniref:XK-related protein n=1 Tax=Euphydryas editha TaxID=104508 RepID=A0AAU9UYX4_EUPED|nr:unnamed protein product [Euphydryas editha]
MVVCELDKDVSGGILGWKIPAWQALLLHRVLPSCGGLVVYLTVMCFDLALAYQHFQRGDKALGMFCVMVMILPAILSLVFTLASPPPGLQTELTAFNVTIQKNDIKWIFEEILRALFFPVAAIGRYCYLIFWWIEAVYASRDQDEKRTREALSRARMPSSMELYLFLQAFIHCAPHAIINALDMMIRYANPAFDKINLQAISMIASSLRMASTATTYRRFEREKLCGRKYPWSINNNEKDNNYNDNETQNKNANNEILENKYENQEENNTYETVLKRQSSEFKSFISHREEIISNMIQFSPRSSEFHNTVNEDDIYSDESSNYMSPEARNEEQNSDDEYVKPISIIDKVAPRRRETDYVIERVYIPAPPTVTAPRPGSFAVWAEKLIENAESIPTWLSAPPRRKHWEVIQEEPDIPRRIPLSYMRGLEPQDATAALVNFLGWYAFFVARLLSIAAFIDFFPFIAIIILMIHYQVMLLLLIVPQASTMKRAFYVFLAFIYLFCLMEFKIRFRHVRVWHMFWIIVCTVEIVVFILIWASVDNKLHYWWRNYIVTVTIVSMLLSYVLLTVYFLLLQPRETVIYINKNNNKNIKQ